MSKSATETAAVSNHVTSAEPQTRGNGEGSRTRSVNEDDANCSLCSAK
jgi:hypothetical protein